MPKLDDLVKDLGGVECLPLPVVCALVGQLAALQLKLAARMATAVPARAEHRSDRLFGTRPRYPWDPRAVSDPWLVEEEFGRQRTPTATGVEREQGHAARETPAKTTRTGPLEFKDEATGAR